LIISSGFEIYYTKITTHVLSLQAMARDLVPSKLDTSTSDTSMSLIE